MFAEPASTYVAAAVEPYLLLKLLTKAGRRLDGHHPAPCFYELRGEHAVVPDVRADVDERVPGPQTALHPPCQCGSQTPKHVEVALDQILSVNGEPCPESRPYDSLTRALTQPGTYRKNLEHDTRTHGQERPVGLRKRGWPSVVEEEIKILDGPWPGHEALGHGKLVFR